MLHKKNYVDRPKTKSAIVIMKIIFKICTFSIKKPWFYKKKTIELTYCFSCKIMFFYRKSTYFENYTFLWNLIFGMGGDANVKLCVQHFYPRGSAPPRWEIGGGVWPWGLYYNAFNLPSHPNHKYKWLRGGDLNHWKVHFR
jgi:hypothetical protein